MTETKTWGMWGARLSLAAVTLILVFVRPTQVPALWFDEGWVMSVARNWLELGYYGEVNAGAVVPDSILNIGFPVTGAVAGSFSLFGIGVFQARMPEMLYTVGAYVLMYMLVRRLWDESIARATWIVLLFMTPLLPIWWGRQVLGEMPSVFFLSGAYLCLYVALEKRPWAAVGAAILFTLACLTKLQSLPFALLSLGIGVAWAARSRNVRTKTVIAGTLIGFCAAYVLALWLQRTFLGYGLGTGSARPILGLTSVALSWLPRLSALGNMAVYGIPTSLGIIYSINRIRSQHLVPTDRSAGRIIRVILLAAVASWLCWFLFVSIGWHRYLIVPVFIGAPFLCDMLRDWSRGFRFRPTLTAAASVVGRRGDRRQNLSALGALLVASLGFTMSMRDLTHEYLGRSDYSLRATVAYLNTATGPDAMIETYELVLLPFVERNVSYPPADTTLGLVEARYVRGAPANRYDPFSADPDYLVTGPEHVWNYGLYQAVIDEDQFLLLQDYGKYQVYGRVR